MRTPRWPESLPRKGKCKQKAGNTIEAQVGGNLFTGNFSILAPRVARSLFCSSAWQQANCYSVPTELLTACDKREFLISVQGSLVAQQMFHCSVGKHQHALHCRGGRSSTWPCLRLHICNYVKVLFILTLFSLCGKYDPRLRLMWRRLLGKTLLMWALTIRCHIKAGLHNSYAFKYIIAISGGRKQTAAGRVGWGGTVRNISSESCWLESTQTPAQIPQKVRVSVLPSNRISESV